MNKNATFSAAICAVILASSSAFAASGQSMPLSSGKTKLEAGKFCCKSATKSGGGGCFEQTNKSKSCPTDRYTIDCTGNTTLGPEGPDGTGTLKCGKPAASAPLVKPKAAARLKALRKSNRSRAIRR